MSPQRLSLPARVRLRSLPRDKRGTAVMEFGLIAAPFFMLMIGSFDVAYQIYARSVFVGAVERAARASSLESADTAKADKMVKLAIDEILPGVVITSTRTSYFDFADIERPEKFTDSNGNKKCDAGEAFVDENRSGKWEADIGKSGNGGASDVVMYTVTATYSPLFRPPFMHGLWKDRSMTSTAVKKNQPFGNQQAYATTAGTCTS